MISKNSPEDLLDGGRLVDDLGPPEVEQQIAVIVGQPVLDRGALLGVDVVESGSADFYEDPLIGQTEVVEKRRLREREQMRVVHAEPIENRLQLSLTEARDALSDTCRNLRGGRDARPAPLLRAEMLDLG